MVSPIRYRGYMRPLVPTRPAPSRRHSHPLPKPKPKVVKSPIKSPRSDRSPNSTLSPAQTPTDEGNNTVQYEIIVVTGDALWAGTDANVYITLCGTEGETGKRQLTKKYTNLFERGRTDCFTLKAKKNLGKLTLLHIEEDDTGVGPAWLLDRVEVINLLTNKKTLFLCGEWLDREHGLDRYLLPEPDEDPPDIERVAPEGQPSIAIEITAPQEASDLASAIAAEYETPPPEYDEAVVENGEVVPDGSKEDTENADNTPEEGSGSEDKNG